MNSYKQSLYASIVRIMANLAMVGAIFIAMFQAHRWPGWPSEAVFCLFFFGITIPVWTAAILLTRWLRSKYPAEEQSLVTLPGRGKQLVKWRVLERPGEFLVRGNAS